MHGDIDEAGVDAEGDLEVSAERGATVAAAGKPEAEADLGAERGSPVDRTREENGELVGEVEPVELVAADELEATEE